MKVQRGPAQLDELREMPEFMRRSLGYHAAAAAILSWAAGERLLAIENDHDVPGRWFVRPLQIAARGESIPSIEIQLEWDGVQTIAHMLADMSIFRAAGAPPLVSRNPARMHFRFDPGQLLKRSEALTLPLSHLWRKAQSFSMDDLAPADEVQAAQHSQAPELT